VRVKESFRAGERRWLLERIPASMAVSPLSAENGGSVSWGARARLTSAGADTSKAEAVVNDSLISSPNAVGNYSDKKWLADDRRWNQPDRAAVFSNPRVPDSTES
jgi:hypothetical protein